MLKKLGWGILVFVSLLLLFILVAVAPIDDTPLDQLSAANTTYSRLDSLTISSDEGAAAIQAGWSSINITPQTPLDMAGYGPRGPYRAVRDSLFARVIVLENAKTKAVIVSLDLLMFPPLVKDKIYEKLWQHGFSKNNIFFTATHTHNGYGNWDNSIAGAFIFGDYQNELVQHLTDQIITAVLEAQNHSSPVEMGFQQIDAHELVLNRLAGNEGTIDPYLRVISFKNQQNDMAMLVSFAGHATNLDADIWVLSRDYPGILVDELEKKETIDFAMFSAGMVGSHNIDSDIPKGPERIRQTGILLADKILAVKDSIQYGNYTTIGGLDVKIDLPPSQLRITKNLRIRNWLFRYFLGSLRANIKVLKIGDILLIGMPCDFSGELSVNNQLDQIAAQRGKNLFITSFNGNYVGYITEDSHYYSCDHDEVRVMNWVGPHKGVYFTEIVKRLINSTM